MCMIDLGPCQDHFLFLYIGLALCAPASGVSAQRLRNAAKIYHEQAVRLRVSLYSRQGAVHAHEPRITFNRSNFEMSVHQPDIRMAVPLQIELWATQKSRKKFKLRFTGMRQPMPPVVHCHQRGACGVVFDDIVERLDELFDARFATDQLIRCSSCRHSTIWRPSPGNAPCLQCPPQRNRAQGAIGRACHQCR